MIQSFKLPDLGEGIHEGEVLAVLVSEGDEVKEGDLLLEVETDKAAVEIPSPYDGKVVEIKVKAGDVVHVGDVLVTIDDGAAKQTGEPASPQKGKPASPQKMETPPETEPVQPRPSKGPVPASPATRRLARELGVDLHQVPGKGPGGRVTAEDVRMFAEKGQPVQPLPADSEKAAVPQTGRIQAPAEPLPVQMDTTQWGPVERVPLRSIRKSTAKHMALSWSRIPHISTQEMVDITSLEAFRQKHKKAIENQGGRLTLTVLVLKAVAAVLKELPRFNASLDDEAGEIVLKKHYHMGVATDTKDGLIVPVIRNVDQKSITELALELPGLVDRTRARKVALEELQGGTFTITNLGRGGGLQFSPIINYPQSAILGLGAARLQPAVDVSDATSPRVVAKLMVPVILGMDHRLLDGADGAKFMKRLSGFLEDPQELLLVMV